MSDIREQTVGSIDYLVIEFPDGQAGGQGFDEIVRLVDSGLIRVVDLEFFRKDEAGVVTAVEARSVTADGVDLSDLAGADAHIIAATDTDVVDGLIRPGSVAAVLVYEDLPVLRAMAAWHAEGAVVAAVGQVAEQDLADVLDELEVGSDPDKGV